MSQLHTHFFHAPFCIPHGVGVTLVNCWCHHIMDGICYHLYEFAMYNFITYIDMQKWVYMIYIMFMV